jgi:hypothetical protein
MPDINDLENTINACQMEVFLMAHYADHVQVESGKGYAPFPYFLKSRMFAD